MNNENPNYIYINGRMINLNDSESLKYITFNDSKFYLNNMNQNILAV